MNKLNERLTLIANLSVVVGIIFLAFELQQNTQAIQAQTRDSITEKQMEFSSWIATDPVVADIHERGRRGLEGFDRVEDQMFRMLTHGIFREWENSYYQYEIGLFSPEEFEGRLQRWRAS